MGIGSTRIIQINFIVRNLEKIIEEWNRILGMEPHISEMPGFHQIPTLTEGNPVEIGGVKNAKYLLNTGEDADEDGLVLAFWQPISKNDPWGYYLEKYGEGIIDLEFNVPDREAAYRCIGEVPFHEGYFPHLTYSFVECKDKYGCNFNICQYMDNTQKIEELKRKYGKE